MYAKGNENLHEKISSRSFSFFFLLILRREVVNQEITTLMRVQLHQSLISGLKLMSENLHQNTLYSQIMILKHATIP